MSQEVLAAFGDDLVMVSDWIEHATATDYAALAPIVVRHADAGDVAAGRIMQDAAIQIADLVQALYSRNVPQVALEMGNSVHMVKRHYLEAKTFEEGLCWFQISWPVPAKERASSPFLRWVAAAM